MADSLPFPVMIGDIGGTNARFAQIADPGAHAHRFPTVRTRDYATFGEAMRAAAADFDQPPRSAVVALAGPVTGDTIQLTNAPWKVQPKRAIMQLDLDCMIVLNDFEAKALSLPTLTSDDLESLGGGLPQLGTKVVVGPGTGLGAAAMVRVNDSWIPLPGEGGHIDLGPLTDRDTEIWAAMDKPDGRVSGETILSGSGMVRLYDAVCAVRGQERAHTQPERVTEAALEGSDAAAVETVDLFATCLGRISGDLAMVFMARGGAYLSGDIAISIAPVLRKGGFREAFCNKAPHEELLGSLSTAIIRARDTALAGIETYVRNPDSFVMDLADRTWTP